MIDKKNFYINGQWVSPKSKEEIKVVNPATEQDCAVIGLANKDDVNDAVVAAKNAYDTWAFTSKEERIQLLEKLYDSYKKRWADIAEAITMEMGAPKDFSTKLQAGTGTPEIAGMTTREMVNVIRGLSGMNLISADVVEVSPAYDHAEVTSLAAATIVYELTNLFAKK